MLAWADAGRGERRVLPAGLDTVGDLAALPDGSLLVATQDPLVELLTPDGRVRWAHPSPKADFLASDNTFAVSADGTIVDFGFERRGKSPLRFDLRPGASSRADPPADRQTIPAEASRTSLSRDGLNAGAPTIDGKPTGAEPI